MVSPTIYIINKSGGLIYALNTNQDINVDMVVSSYIHTMYAHILDLNLTQEPETIVPLTITMKRNVLTIYRTLTNYTIVFLSDKSIECKVFQKIYEIFCDYALKDPFYTIEMPINTKKFSENIVNYIKNIK